MTHNTTRNMECNTDSSECNTDGPTCPLCDTPAGQATYSTAPGQSVCPDDECPINTWDARL